MHCLKYHTKLPNIGQTLGMHKTSTNPYSVVQYSILTEHKNHIYYTKIAYAVFVQKQSVNGEMYLHATHFYTFITFWKLIIYSFKHFKFYTFQNRSTWFISWLHQYFSVFIVLFSFILVYSFAIWYKIRI